jgi:PncC family amidohydrolase
METRLAEEIGNLLRERGLTIAIAESSTGGLISHLITNVPGSSSYFKGTVVAYDNEVKIKILGVKRETLEKHKSVSYETGEEMAQGVREALDADIGLSETGIAGPTRGSSGKRVGLFYIGLSSREGNRVEEHVFQGDRLENKQSAAQEALAMLRGYLIELKNRG